jgi:putative DNA methylase
MVTAKRINYQSMLPLVCNATFSKEDELPIDFQFDLKLANELAKFESYNKHLYRPNTYLHKWWARRCGSTFRLILKNLVEDPNKRDYYVSGGLEGKIILDPMMGGGTTLHEAIRLGANVIGADIDPIPILQARATLSHVSLKDLEDSFIDFYDVIRNKVGGLFETACPQCSQQTEIQFTLFGLRRTCGCNEVLFIDSTTLRQEPDGSAISICPICHSIKREFGTDQDECLCHVSGRHNECGLELATLKTKGTKKCVSCGETYKDNYEQPYYSRYVPLVVVGKCRIHGLFFSPASSQDIGKISFANSLRDNLNLNLQGNFEVKPGPKSRDLIRHGVNSYLDLFSSRQLIYLNNSIELISTFDPVIRLNLALLVSTSLEFNSMLCGYKGVDKRRPGAIRHTFSHHAYSFPYTALENNPIYPLKTSGTLQNLFHNRILRARKWACRPTEHYFVNRASSRKVLLDEIDSGYEVNEYESLREGKRQFLLIQGSSTNLDLSEDSVDWIVTDPPYYDSVQYSDLAAYFRVWLQLLLPNDAKWNAELEEKSADLQANNDGEYSRVMGEIFAECRRVLRKEKGRLIFTFHHWSAKGWAELTLALKGAGFILINYYVVHSENPISVHVANLKALTHDAILVFAPDSKAGGEWICPEKIHTNKSDKFCEECAEALGWMLNSDLDGSRIKAKWSMLIE